MRTTSIGLSVLSWGRPATASIPTTIPTALVPILVPPGGASKMEAETTIESRHHEREERPVLGA
jgi:hypothetical protein